MTPRGGVTVAYSSTTDEFLQQLSDGSWIPEGAVGSKLPRKLKGWNIMKVKRKILAAALACIMTVGFIPTNAFAAIDVPPSANADVSARATLDGDGPETNPYKDEALTEEISREQTVNPADYSFTVKYVDGEGNSVPGGGTITFDETGAYSREDIPLPYGYMQIVPAHPDNDWLYPTALEFIDGVWTVTNPVVEIMVEPMAKVDIVFKTPDGETLEDFGSTKYYDSIGAGIETVTAPEGYEFIEGNTYAVDVTRDENGKLVADPAEVVFWVKAEGTEVPVNPSDYFFNFRFVDGEGNLIGGGTIYFDKTGPYSREEIELPDGYMQMIPAHPGEDWLYPTALEWKNGEWFVTNMDVEIMVEPMAKVDIIFKTPDGKVLEDLSYTKYYDSIGAGIETVTAPEGYEFVGENTYAVDVTRDENSKLVADPTEVEFVVKAIGSGEPSDPTRPGDDTQGPKTGDSSNLNLWVAFMIVSAGAVFVVLMAKYRRKAAGED